MAGNVRKILRQKQLACGALCAEAAVLDGSCHILLYGGQSPHIGCTVLAEPRPSLLGDGSVSATASVLNGYLLRGMREGRWKTILFAPTGALLSPTSSFQGESVPGICHVVRLCMERN